MSKHSLFLVSGWNWGKKGYKYSPSSAFKPVQKDLNLLELVALGEFK